MAKSFVDLVGTDIFLELMNQGAQEAVKSAHEAGLAVTGTVNGVICNVYPDGRVEPLSQIEELSNRRAYTTEVAERIEGMGAMAVSIANRWMMGWPARVRSLLKADAYLGCLESQLDQEKLILANEANLRHLSRREILQMYEIKESPPALE